MVLINVVNLVESSSIILVANSAMDSSPFMPTISFRTETNPPSLFSFSDPSSIILPSTFPNIKSLNQFVIVSIKDRP